MLQFVNGLGRSRVCHYLSFQTFPLIIREIFLVPLLNIKPWLDLFTECGLSTTRLNLFETLLEILLPPSDRLVNRLRTRSKSPLQGDHSEADDGPPLALTGPLESLHAIHLPAHVVRHGRVEIVLGRREIVQGRIGATLWEQRGLVELEKILLHQPSHQVAGIRLLAIAGTPLKPVWIDELKE